MKSFVDLPSETVRKLANGCLTNIHSWREEAREKVIAEELEKLNHHSWFSKLFHKPPATRALRPVLGELDFIKLRYGAAEEMAEDLLVACAAAETIHITASDLHILMNFQESKSDEAR